MERPNTATMRGDLLGLLKGLQGSDRAEELADWWAQRHFPAVEALADEQVPIALLKAQKLSEEVVPS